MNKTKMKVTTLDEDHVYLDITVHNPTTNTLGGNTQSIPAEFTQSRDQAILDLPSYYNASVARFSLPSDGIPIFIFEDNAYIISFQDRASGISFNQTVLAPNFLNNNQVFSFQAFLNVINEAFVALRNNFAGTFPCPATAPFMIYEPESQLFSLLCDSGYSTNYPTNDINIYFNLALYAKFEAFNTQYFPDGIQSPLDYRFIINPTIPVGGGLAKRVYYPPFGEPNATAYLKFTQDGATDAMSDILSIIMTTNTIPIVKEQIAVRSPTASNSPGTGSQAASLGILTDFYVSQDTFVNPITTQNFTYNPSIFRLIPMQSTSEMRLINVKFYYADRIGRLNEVVIRPGRTMNVKLLFLKKGLTS